LLDVSAMKGESVSGHLARPVSPDASAYLLYTSGSTGLPKGVLQNHRNVLHFSRLYTNRLRLNSNGRLSLFSSCAHDAGVMDIFGALLNGAALYPLNVRTETPKALVQAVNSRAITVLHCTPTVFRHLMSPLRESELLPSVRLVVLGGETADSRDVE